MGLLPNKRFPSCLSPLFQSESWCEAFHMEISFIYMQILVHLHVNKTTFHMKGFALPDSLWNRWKATQKWPIELHYGTFVIPWLENVKYHSNTWGLGKGGWAGLELTDALCIDQFLLLPCVRCLTRKLQNANSCSKNIVNLVTSRKQCNSTRMHSTTCAYWRVRDRTRYVQDHLAMGFNYLM